MKNPSSENLECELILALDVPTKEEAIAVLEELKGSLRWVKIGLQMYVKYGPSIVKEIAQLGYQIFLDLKLHDIPNTVASAIQSLESMPIHMLTLHTSGGQEMMERAKQAKERALPDLTLLGVTVLTSMNQAELTAVGCHKSPEEQVKNLAELAIQSGLNGLVCSPWELSMLRQALGQTPIIVTPGIRPSGASDDDQKRIMPPTKARERGSSYIVVGRPILKADNRISAVERIKAALLA